MSRLVVFRTNIMMPVNRSVVSTLSSISYSEGAKFSTEQDIDGTGRSESTLFSFGGGVVVVVAADDAAGPQRMPSSVVPAGHCS
jgi:hypothetical protein